MKDVTAYRARGVVLCAVLLALWSAAAIWYSETRGWILYYGDAESHLDIARRMVDSQTPGYDQVGSVWLPLPHWAMLPFIGHDNLWHTGLAGAIPSSLFFVIGGAFLFAAVRRLFQSTPTAVAAVALCALNPNMLYIQGAPMTEGIFFGCLGALLYFTVRYRETQAWWAIDGAAVALLLATLTRYDGWFLIPFVTLYFYWAAREHRFRVAFWFGAFVSLGPIFWFLHNQILAHDWLFFYRGPYSAKAIQGGADYPGKGYWPRAFQFYGFCAYFCVGPVLAILGTLGVAAMAAKRTFWPLLLLLLPPAFYLLSMHSGGTPIFVPVLYSGAYYNLRYGLSILPLLAVAAAALVAAFPRWMRRGAAAVAIVAATVPWLIHPNPKNWVVFEEGDQNYRTHRQLEHEVEDYLRPRYVRGAGIITQFGATTAIYRELGIPLRETLSGDNGRIWAAAIRNHFPNQDWAVAIAGNYVEKAVQDAGCFMLVQSYKEPDAPEIHIYRRIGGNRGSS